MTTMNSYIQGNNILEHLFYLLHSWKSFLIQQINNLPFTN
ncbi:hypothetical protein OIU77_005175 [Salix suchowensis]|uniref:Uncharacterized protein n=1 Tax=Salix suchowensis TaxID=1278906 RepID=A0ABQ9ANH8_9ROSI|nr:hypothetical protein OIU77_005175 [Salix suchowensis]